MTLVGLMVLSAFAGSAIAQLSINAAYISQEHTFDYRNGSLDSLTQDGLWLKGATLGASINAPLVGNVGIAPGVYISYAQAKQLIDDIGGGSSNPTTSTFTIKVPFYLNYKIPVGVSTDVLIFGGPVVNLGLSSLSNYSNVSTQIDAHFDMGGTIAAGIQFHRFRIFAGYNINLIDREDFTLANKQSVKKAWEGSSLFVGLGLSFGSSQQQPF
ncbi:MAG: hypothetical protein IJ745_03300 [Bacteroidales bacterium]|nr:hypothetical protein [Bacteroidales bacterium]